MSIVLPPSLDKDLHPLDKEVAYARSLTPEERLRVVALVCRSALHALNMHQKRDQLLQRRDPVPASTQNAFRRLRIPR